MIGVGTLLVEQLANQSLTFIWRRIREERVGFGGRGQQTDDIEINAADESHVVQRGGRLDLMVGEIRIEDAVNGMLQAGARRRQSRPARLERDDVAAATK